VQNLGNGCRHMCVLFRFGLHGSTIGGVGDLYPFKDALVLLGPPWGSTGGKVPSRTSSSKTLIVCPPNAVVRNVSRAFGHVESAANFA